MALAPVGLAAFSPYGADEATGRRQLAESTEIAAPCDSVFAYLGNSANASDWSVFVDHITPLNADSVPDGARGSIRRSFRNADETGMRWDEYFTEVVPGRKRELRVYDVVGAWLTADATLMTEQLHEPLADGGCRLAFTLFFGDEPSALDEMKMHAASYVIARTFRSNIDNVRRLNEARVADGGT